MAGVCVSRAPETPFPFHGVRSGKIPLGDRLQGRGRGVGGGGWGVGGLVEDFRGNQLIFGRTKGEISGN